MIVRSLGLGTAEAVTMVTVNVPVAVRALLPSQRQQGRPASIPILCSLQARPLEPPRFWSPHATFYRAVVLPQELFNLVNNSLNHCE